MKSDRTIKDQFAESVSVQAAQMVAMAVTTPPGEMREELFDFARRLAAQAKRLGRIDDQIGE